MNLTSTNQHRCPWPVMPAAVLLLIALPLSGASFKPPLRTEDGFAVPQQGQRFEFPRDHGSHPEFKIEWWYITGHLFDGDEQRYGFQATFFRRAGPRGPAGKLEEHSPQFAHDELHLAHMALTDVTGKQFHHEERLNRRGWDADASTNTLALHNGNWSLRLGTNGVGSMALTGSIHADAAYTLELTPRKPLVFFGDDGVSRKGAAPTAASHYLTWTRLEVAGQLTVNGRERPVRGEAWMDHEISSSQLDDDQAGWDWASLQLNDGREVMAYRMRKLDGSTDPFSRLAWVDAEGGLTQDGSGEFTWSAARIWTSPTTGAEYPVGVTITTRDPATGNDVSFTLEPLLMDQELHGAVGGVAYWEGACRVRDASGEEVGSAYLELAGYLGSLNARFK
ncbi:MAG TPA: carotenoid 1,2-hydratase [Verrucomicrobiales bacterium]|nr:carotenoid 1,2-hydratase [Verrucomicrobiales bacterium]